MSKTDWTLFSATGTTHLVVISGMHLGILISCFYLLLRCVLAWVPGLCLHFPATCLAALCCLPLAWFYAHLAGFALPVQRAFIMAAVSLFSLFLCRHRSVYDAYCLALMLVLLFNPLAGMSPGFWLSFCAVGILLVFVQRTANGDERAFPLLARLAELLKSQCMIFIGLLPLMLLLFQQSSLLAPLVNLAAIPFITLQVVPLCLLALLVLLVSPSGFAFLCLLIDGLLAVFMHSLQVMLTWFPQALLQLPALPGWQWVYILSLTALSLFTFRAKKPGLSLLLLLAMIPGFIPTDRSLPGGHFQFDILDVGQGLALVISTREHVLLYDLGPRYSAEFNAGEGIVLPFLRARNIREVDRVIISHGDQDHAGGLSPILERFPETKYLSSALKTCRISPMRLCVAPNSSGIGMGFNLPCCTRMPTFTGATMLPVSCWSVMAASTCCYPGISMLELSGNCSSSVQGYRRTSCWQPTMVQEALRTLASFGHWLRTTWFSPAAI